MQQPNTQIHWPTKLKTTLHSVNLIIASQVLEGQKGGIMLRADYLASYSTASIWSLGNVYERQMCKTTKTAGNCARDCMGKARARWNMLENNLSVSHKAAFTASLALKTIIHAFGVWMEGTLT